jgi:hypothetical protein
MKDCSRGCVSKEGCKKRKEEKKEKEKKKRERVCANGLQKRREILV